MATFGYGVATGGNGVASRIVALADTPASGGTLAGRVAAVPSWFGDERVTTCGCDVDDGILVFEIGVARRTRLESPEAHAPRAAAARSARR